MKPVDSILSGTGWYNVNAHIFTLIYIIMVLFVKDKLSLDKELLSHILPFKFWFGILIFDKNILISYN